jgi:alginate O-acetyltransferase complex protein AlgI
MLFNSYEFLFLLLPLTLLGYYLLVPASWRLGFLTVISYIFYGWWDYRFCALMFLTTVINYYAALGISRANTPSGKRGWLLVSVVSGLCLLGFFKYYGLFARSTNGIASWIHGGPVQVLPEWQLILPIGISFYTFHSMSYAIDVYRGVVKPVHRFINFACFVSLFSQLVAGPILRYRDLAQQLVARTHTLEKAATGIAFFTLGFAKKVILADGVAPLAQHVFDGSHGGLFQSWAGVLAYTMQIYFDFSGYSDMAVGLGYLFGFQILQNFNSPYKSVSITDFWRRWHISLSTWLRDYLYVSLGGNRGGPARTYFNLFLTMLLGGLWHGAEWTFVVWGAYHGLLLVLERSSPGRNLLSRAPVFLQRLATFIAVMIGWVFFRCHTLSDAAAMFGGMLGRHGIDWDWHQRAQMNLSLVILPVCLIIAMGPANTWEIKWKHGWIEALFIAALFMICVMIMLVNSSSPFLYFQF